MTTALRTLLEHAERQRNDALALLLQAEEAARRLQQQTEQLLTYRDEYRQRHPGLGGRSVSIELLRGHHDFMLRLEQALEQQQVQIQACEQRVTARREELLQLETRVASVKKLLERRHHDERRRVARHEQRRSDEAAQQQRRTENVRRPAFAAPTDAVPLTH